MNNSSAPSIVFYDKTTIATRTITLPRPSPGGWMVSPGVARAVNRVETGLTQTLAFHRFDEITWASEFVDDAQADLLTRLFRSTFAREEFTFRGHASLSTAFPSASLPIEDNVWVARWKIGYDKLAIKRSSGIDGLWSVSLEMEGEAVGVL